MRRTNTQKMVLLSLAIVLGITCLVVIRMRGAANSDTYDLVIVDGRVIDPESKRDAIATVAINNGRIAAITNGPLQGKVTIDARGLVVAPGFIDLHSHGQDDENYRFKVMDGVTSALELELGTADPESWYKAREGKALINFGASVGHVPIRMTVMHDVEPEKLVPSGDAARKPATEVELKQINESFERGLQAGGLGIGLGIQYTPAASHEEILNAFRIAAQHNAVVFVHMRYLGGLEPNNSLSALEEVIAAAAITGAHLHIAHISSMGLRQTHKLLEVIQQARRNGIDVTTECYPYTAAETEIGSAVFDEGWQQVMGIDYQDLQWVDTGERLTKETFQKYRKQGGLVIIHFIPDGVAEEAVASPLTIIASDGLMIKGKGHPRGAGTYARVLGYYVREKRALTLMEALNKMTALPAQRLEAFVPEFKNKGRLRVGADADIVIFDASRVVDKATYELPGQYSQGIQYSIVNGIIVVRNGTIIEGVRPGRPLRARRSN
jgi:dihydroorotase